MAYLDFTPAKKEDIGVKIQVRHLTSLIPSWGFTGSSDGKESACNAGNLGLIPGWEIAPGEENSLWECSSLLWVGSRSNRRLLMAPPWSQGRDRWSLQKSWLSTRLPLTLSQCRMEGVSHYWKVRGLSPGSLFALYCYCLFNGSSLQPNRKENLGSLFKLLWHHPVGKGLWLSSSLKPNNCGSLNFPLSLCCWQWRWDHGFFCVICLEWSHLKVSCLKLLLPKPLAWEVRLVVLLLLLLFSFSESLVSLWFALSAVVGTSRLSASLHKSKTCEGKRKPSSPHYVVSQITSSLK